MNEGLHIDLGEEVESWLKTHCQNMWFMEHHAQHLRPDFLKWWASMYGLPGNYADVDAQDEYFTRMAFAQMGWIAAMGATLEMVQMLKESRPA